MNVVVQNELKPNQQTLILIKIKENKIVFY